MRPTPPPLVSSEEDAKMTLGGLVGGAGGGEGFLAMTFFLGDGFLGGSLVDGLPLCFFLSGDSLVLSWNSCRSASVSGRVE